MEITKLTCDLCQCSFATKHNLQKHLNTHVLHLKEQKLVFNKVKQNYSIIILEIDFFVRHTQSKGKDTLKLITIQLTKIDLLFKERYNWQSFSRGRCSYS